MLMEWQNQQLKIALLQKQPTDSIQSPSKPNHILHRTRKKSLEIHIEGQNTPTSQSNLE